MSTQSITVGSTTYNLVSIPSSPGPSQIELGMSDSVAVFSSPFTGQEQIQRWPGADFWDATITLPSMTLKTSAAWEAFLAECMGRANVFQLGDSRYKTPLAGGVGTGQVTSNATSMTNTLVTGSWSGTVPIVGDYVQCQYRLYKITSVSGGTNTIFTVWPSIREPIVSGTQVTSSNPTGLFRLAGNRRSVNWSPDRLSTLSFKAVEAR
jgi:hypothetical protein